MTDDWSECSGPQKSRVEMNLASLQSLHGLHQSYDESTYSANGANPQRIKALLREPPCSCKCTMPFKPLLACSQTFWGLPKEAQDGLLWNIQSGGGRKTHWSIEGLGLEVLVLSIDVKERIGCFFSGILIYASHCFLTPLHFSVQKLLPGYKLCREAWMKYLGVGRQRMSRTKKRYRGVDERKLSQGSRAAVLPQKVYTSLMLVVMLETDSTLNFAEPWGVT